MAKPRVLLIAEQANPEFVSVPLEGWSHSQALAQVADTHLVTQVRNREAILKAGLVEGDDFTAIDSEKVAARMHKLSGILRGGKGKGWTTVMALNAVSYAYFEKLVWKQFGEAIKNGEYDIVHRLTPLSPTLPSKLAKKCKKAGVPFVWGPINGGVAWPKEFNAARRAEREWLSYVRDAYKLLPGYRATRQKAHTIIVGSTATYEQVPAIYHDKCVYVPENAIDPGRFVARRSRTVQPGEPIKLAFVGRLVPYKGADMLLDAVAQLVREKRVTVTIIGDGPERGKLEGIIERENLAEGVNLAGWVEHSQLQHTLAEHDVFSFPSIREFGGAVVLEAMAVGLVPVVVEYGGPGELVTERTGYRVPIGSREKIVEDVRAAITQIADAPEQLEPMSAAAIRRVEQLFTWPAKASQVAQVYAHAAGQTNERPDFGMPLPDVEAQPSSSSSVEAGSPSEPVGASGGGA
ncbi:glycosyltransferase family 4 protein [Algisphaera agarilytica]|uniref:Glycosyltransferase involved in cell wall biosynthesis n=1 Tax=Algisphaera agarilytica TaxID=1385975 RepID=A0A7X0LL25_9BACT|nr:glycosyltransferase [Algisphaera agarilytica]MBB6430439.1 glycosyltransferase involved in cell wall biosynthesis [Algisphaera agarilytica]